MGNGCRRRGSFTPAGQGKAAELPLRLNCPATNLAACIRHNVHFSVGGDRPASRTPRASRVPRPRFLLLGSPNEVSAMSAVAQLPQDEESREALRVEAQRYLTNYAKAVRTVLAYIQRQLRLLSEWNSLDTFCRANKTRGLEHFLYLSRQRYQYANGPFCVGDCSPGPLLRPYLDFESRSDAMARWRAAKEREIAGQERAVELGELWKMNGGPRDDAELASYIDAYRSSLLGMSEALRIEETELLDAARDLLRALEDPGRMTVEAANRKGMQLAKQYKQRFFAFSIRQQADLIGCSFGTWTKTPFYKQAKKRRRHQRPAGKQGACSPSTASLTGNLEATVGKGERDEVLNQLIAEQEANQEPSPLDDDPPDDRPKRVRHRKRL
jgi:hypothetical protein